MAEEFKIKLPGKVAYIQTAKLAIGAIASTEGFNLEEVDDIKIAVGDACKHITCHDHNYWSRAYEMVVTAEENDLKIVITDCDPGNHDVPKDSHICIDCPEEGKLSVDIIKTLVDEVSVESGPDDGCRVITMVKHKGNVAN